MNRLLIGATLAAGLGLGGVTAAQEPAAAPSTSAAAPSKPVAAPGKSSPRSGAQAEAGEPRANTAAPALPAADRKSAVPTPAVQKPAGQKGKGVDRLELGAATVTGDREQPKVLYIVPWKKSDIGDLSGKPLNSLLDEALMPVDRDEFRREVAYYGAMQAEPPRNGVSRGKAPQGEK